MSQYPNAQQDDDLSPHPDRPQTWPVRLPLIMAHDVGRARDHSTAVIGCHSPFPGAVVGILDLRELPQGLYGSARASAVAAVDREYNNNCLIVADLSNEASYGEFLYQTFGPRLIGVQICSHGDGTQAEIRPVGQGAAIPVYNVGRTHLLESFHSVAASHLVRMVPGPESQRAYAQLKDLQVEQRDSGTVYKTLPGHHDDLGISMCMLVWAARHPHMRHWVIKAFRERLAPPQRPRPISSGGWT
jgi:hypothetical protein